jgi:hypothetical protein
VVTTVTELRLPRRVEAGAGLALLVALSGYATLVDPHEPGHFPTCPVLALTGYACPGCGSLRALHDLFHGRFGEAAGHNVTALIVLPLAVLIGVRVAVLGRPARPAPTWLPLAVLAAVVVWTVARNLPFAPFQALAP